MVCRTVIAPKHHHRWCNANNRELDRNDGSVSLFEGTEICLARSRFYDAKTDGEYVACPASRSAHDRLRCQRGGKGSRRTACELSSRLFCFRSCSCISLHVRPELEPSNQPGASPRTRPTVESFGSELYSAQSETRRSELAHFERKVDSRRRAFRPSCIESPEGMRGALSL